MGCEPSIPVPFYSKINLHVTMTFKDMLENRVMSTERITAVGKAHSGDFLGVGWSR